VDGSKGKAEDSGLKFRFYRLGLVTRYWRRGANALT
jgi:hypothetical protein